MTTASLTWKRRAIAPSVSLVPLTPEEFGAVLGDLRRQRRLSQQAAADLIGISYRTYQRWEAGQSKNPQLRNLDKAIIAFNVSPSTFLGQPEVTPGDVATRLEGLEGKVDRLLGELVPAVAALEADLHRLAQAAPPTAKTRAAKTNRRKAS